MEKKVGVYSPVAAYENMVGAAVWQMSAECHGLMMQAFNIGKRNVDEMVAKARQFARGEGFASPGESKAASPSAHPMIARVMRRSRLAASR